jgi:hypothetical protein
MLADLWTSLRSLEPTVEPTLVWGLFTRMVGLVLAISFTSLSFQVVKVSGRAQPLGARARLAKIREDFPTFRRFFYFPTLLWISDRDVVLRLLTLTGLVSALSIVVGGPHTPYAFIVCYVCYLSLDLPMGLIFPWDCLMFEAILLGIFLPALDPLPELTSSAAPAPLLTWAYRIMLFRVMFGFGKIKFAGATKADTSYLKGFLTAQPLPSYLGWLAQKLPPWALRQMLFFMFIVEIPLPFLAFVPGWPSVVTAVATIMLMVGIQAMGSFGYFSLVTIAVCVTLFDNQTPREFSFATAFDPGAPVVTNAYVILHTLAALIVFPFNSWVGQSWSNFSFYFRFKHQWLLAPIHAMRLLHPFRWVHPFGVFPPKAFPAIKGSVVVQVSWDGETWHECDFTYFAYKPSSKPVFLAPHHPREDQAIIYETFGLNPNSLISSMAGPFEPYPYGRRPGASLYLQAVLDGYPIRCKASKDHVGPPKVARVVTVMLEPTTLEELRRTGNYWKRSYIGPHAPPQTLDVRYRDEILADPEFWHWEAIIWRRRSRLRPMLEAARAGVAPARAVLADGPPLTDADVDAFWDEFVPAVGLEDRTNWDNLPETRARLFERFDPAALERFERLLNRFSIVLAERLEPHYLGKGFFNPPIPAKTYLHLWMLIQHVIGKGRQTFEAVYQEPLSAREHLEDMTVYTGTYYLCIFRFWQMVFDAQKLRLIRAFMGPYEDPEPPLTPMQQKLLGLAHSLFGYFELADVLVKHFKGPDYDLGCPERYPKFQVDADGVVQLVRRPEEVPVPDLSSLPRV